MSKCPDYTNEFYKKLTAFGKRAIDNVFLKVENNPKFDEWFGKGKISTIDNSIELNSKYEITNEQGKTIPVLTMIDLKDKNAVDSVLSNTWTKENTGIHKGPPGIYYETAYEDQDEAMFSFIRILNNKYPGLISEGKSFIPKNPRQYPISKDNGRIRRKEAIPLDINYAALNKRPKLLPNVNPTTGQISLLAVTTNQKKEKVNKQLEDLLKQQLQRIGVNIEYFDVLVDKLGLTIDAAYDLSKRLILLSKGEKGLRALPEEAGHAFEVALGKNHPLLRGLYQEIDRTPNWRELLTEKERYEELYGVHNEDQLKKELAGQLIGKAIIGEFKRTYPTLKDKVFSIISSIIRRVKQLFSKADINSLEDTRSSLMKEAGIVAERVLSKEGITREKGLPQEEGTLYAVGTKEERRKGKKIQETENKQNRALAKTVAFFKRKQITLKKELDDILKKEGNSKRYQSKLEDYNNLSERLSGVQQELNRGILYDLGSKELAALEYKLKNNLIQTREEITEASTLIKEFLEFPELKSLASQLHTLLLVKERELVLENIKTFTTLPDEEKDNLDLKIINKDIGTYGRWVGALSDIGDMFGQTISTMVKFAQNLATRNATKEAEDISKAISKLKEYQNPRGLSGKDIYDIFIEEKGGTLVLTQIHKAEFYKKRNEAFEKLKSENDYTVEEGRSWLKDNTYKNEEGEWRATEKWLNPTYKTIQDTPELKEFFDFFKEKIEFYKDKLPIGSQLSKDFIPNLVKGVFEDVIVTNRASIYNGFKDALGTLGKNVETDEEGNILLYDEEFMTDTIPLRYIKKVSAKKKSRDLGEALQKFAEFATNYEQMAEVLPQVRIIQDVIKDKQFVNSHGTTTINGETTNLFKLTENFIQQQIKGIRKTNQGLMFQYDSTDADGNEVKKQIYLSQLVDVSLRYNSLLKIGWNPFNAVNNSAWANISNYIEALGGLHFNPKELRKSNGIFFSEIFDQNSKINKLIHLLNPLQEAADYENVYKVKLSGKAKKILTSDSAYFMMRKGELQAQTTTMIASMIHDGTWDLFSLDKDGELIFDETKAGYKLNEIALGKMTDKIQKINQVIHGRYSSRDSSAANQYFLFRAAIQFRKWLPTAIEQRIQERKFDNRLGMEVEGRYKTIGRLAKEGWKEDGIKGVFGMYIELFQELWQVRKDIREGKKFEAFELYNIRKTLNEIVILMAIVGLYALIGPSKDDDKDKKKRLANPYVKFWMDQSNRLAGDISNMYNPVYFNRLIDNPIPLAKTSAQILNTLHYLPYIFGGEDSEYDRGNKKGENKFWSNTTELIPGARTGKQVYRLWNGQKYSVK